MSDVDSRGISRASGGIAEAGSRNDQQKSPQPTMTVDRGLFLLMNFGRGERIRTSDPSVPNRVLYQAEPRPDKREQSS
jgi:hypothetical protein